MFYFDVSKKQRTKKPFLLQTLPLGPNALFVDEDKKYRACHPPRDTQLVKTELETSNPGLRGDRGAQGWDGGGFRSELSSLLGPAQKAPSIFRALGAVLIPGRGGDPLAFMSLI